MTYDPELARLGVYDERAPRYTSYPTAVQFTSQIGPQFTKNALGAIPVDKPVSIYVHIPFCERLCWFCACRTQGTKSASPVTAYLDHLIKEIDLVADQLPHGIKTSHIHWGGGTPTILTPPQILRLGEAIRQQLPFAKDVEFSVEIDPTLIDPDKVHALVDVGMTRASIGVQDFAHKVQSAIGRVQSVETTRDCVSMLRQAQVHSLNMDILYGLPYQTQASVLDTIRAVTDLSPDRIALYGYAHVPWMAKRQKLIDESALPTGQIRHELFQIMTTELENFGYTALGIDHFSKPTDTMAYASKTKELRRNFQGYTTDNTEILIGLGASSISKYPNGYVKNLAKSSDYMRAINAGELASYRGIETTQDDRIIARVIEMIMCDFTVSYPDLRAEFGEDLSCINTSVFSLQKKFSDVIQFSKTGFSITRNQRYLARLIAKNFDQYINETAQFSTVS